MVGTSIIIPSNIMKLEQFFWCILMLGYGMNMINTNCQTITLPGPKIPHSIKLEYELVDTEYKQDGSHSETTYDVTLCISAPKFYIKNVLYRDKKQIYAMTNAYDGQRFQTLDNNNSLSLTSSSKNIKIDEILLSPLLVPWMFLWDRSTVDVADLLSGRLNTSKFDYTPNIILTSAQRNTFTVNTADRNSGVKKTYTIKFSKDNVPMSWESKNERGYSASVEMVKYEQISVLGLTMPTEVDSQDYGPNQKKLSSTIMRILKAGSVTDNDSGLFTIPIAQAKRITDIDANVDLKDGLSPSIFPITPLK